MTKLKAGLLSLGARGTIGNAVTFQERGQVNFARTKPIPQYRRSQAQNYQRWDYEDAIFFWNSLTDSQKAEYRTLGSKYHLTAFAYVIRLYLRTLPDLVGRWRLDEASGAVAYDSSKQGNNGTIIGATPTTGIINGAYDFDGLNDFITCGLDPIHSPPSLTIEFFFNHKDVEATGAGDRRQIGKGAGADAWELLFKRQGDERVIFLSNPGFTTVFAHTITRNTDQHIVITHEDNGLDSLSLDGLFKQAIATGVLTAGALAPLVIGRGTVTVTYAKAMLDHATLYNRVLSAEQILNHSERRYPLQ